MLKTEVFLPPERVAVHEAAGHWPCAGMSAMLEERRRGTPDRLFLIDGSERLTFAQFAGRVERVASALLALGIAPGDVVSWQLPSWWEAAVVAVAIDWIGAINNPIIPIYREREVSFIAAQAGTRALIVPGVFRNFDFRELAAEVRRGSPGLEHVIVVRDRPGEGMRSFGDLLGSVPGSRPAARDPYEVAMLFYTSGTTADPKGVMHTDATLGSFARTNAVVAGGGPEDAALLQFPVSHIGGLAAFVMLPILKGSRVVYVDFWDPERALSLIEQEGITGAGGPPAILQGMLAAPGFSPHRVRTVRLAATGAADVPPELIREIRRRFGAVSYRSYGLTECPMLTSGRADDPEDKCVYTDGRPTPGCRVRIMDEAGRLLPSGTEGEIEAFGPQMCVGYLDPSLTAAAFTSDGFVRTGDLGIVDEQGYVRVTGRKKDIIIRKGENLSAKAIEDVLHDHPSVAEAAVIGVPDPDCGERVCACLVLRAGAKALNLADIRRFMEAKQVMRQKIPERLELLPSLPRNATGKVLKHELRRRFGESSR
ncbi:MAG TPA: AMP-binding protein [Candidatus Binatia bacterium]|nr:AMP-binding protein [Candidatus Binatia bacterium]